MRHRNDLQSATIESTTIESATLPPARAESPSCLGSSQPHSRHAEDAGEPESAPRPGTETLRHHWTSTPRASGHANGRTTAAGGSSDRTSSTARSTGPRALRPRNTRNAQRRHNGLVTCVASERSRNSASRSTSACGGRIVPHLAAEILEEVPQTSEAETCVPPRTLGSPAANAHSRTVSAAARHGSPCPCPPRRPRERARVRRDSRLGEEQASAGRVIAPCWLAHPWSAPSGDHVMRSPVA